MQQAGRVVDRGDVGRVDQLPDYRDDDWRKHHRDQKEGARYLDKSRLRVQQQSEQHAEQDLEQHAPKGELGLDEKRIDEARIAWKQAIIPQRCGKIGRGAGIDQLERGQARDQQIKCRQTCYHQQDDQTGRQRPTIEAAAIGIDQSPSRQSAVPERRRLAMACSCAAFMASWPESWPVTTCSTALLMTSPTMGNSFTVR